MEARKNYSQKIEFHLTLTQSGLPQSELITKTFDNPF